MAFARVAPLAVRDTLGGRTVRRSEVSDLQVRPLWRRGQGHDEIGPDPSTRAAAALVRLFEVVEEEVDAIALAREGRRHPDTCLAQLLAGAFQVVPSRTV